MKVILGLIFCLNSLISISQIKIDTIEVGFYKPPMLIFDGDAKSTYGNEDIEVLEIGNKIVIKALKEGFEETNLYVEVGTVAHVFIVRYAHSPKQHLYNYQKSALISSAGTSSQNVVNVKTQMEVRKDSLQKDSIATMHDENCRLINSKGQAIFDRAESKYKIMFLTTNMYVKDSHFYIKLGIQNGSEIDYRIQFIRTEIRNASNRMKATSEQKVQLIPSYINNPATNVKANTFSTPILVFEEFVLDKNRKFHIEMWEQSGDRILQFDITYQDILKIKELR